MFVFGLDATANPKVCGAIAGFLHYLFLASFAWMFVEAIHVYLMLVKVSHKMGWIRIWSRVVITNDLHSRESLLFQVFDTGKSMMWKFYAIGYGAPAFVVFISVLVSETTNIHGYGSERK